jgi:hypothetical protein
MAACAPRAYFFDLTPAFPALPSVLDQESRT